MGNGSAGKLSEFPASSNNRLVQLPLPTTVAFRHRPTRIIEANTVRDQFLHLPNESGVTGVVIFRTARRHYYCDFAAHTLRRPVSQLPLMCLAGTPHRFS